MAEPMDPPASEPAAPAVTAPIGRQFTNLEAARFIACFLLRAGEKVGVDPADSWDDFARRILAAAQGGQLPADECRLVWQLALMLR